MQQKQQPPSPLNKAVLIRAGIGGVVLLVLSVYGGALAQEVGVPNIIVTVILIATTILTYISMRRAWFRQ